MEKIGRKVTPDDVLQVVTKYPKGITHNKLERVLRALPASLSYVLDLLYEQGRIRNRVYDWLNPRNQVTYTVEKIFPI